MSINKEKTLGAVRHILTIGGGYAVGAGHIDENVAVEAVGILTALIGFIWSWISPEKKKGLY